jgi:hypothetical protein
LKSQEEATISGYRSGSDRNSGLRSGKAHGVSVTGSAIGRADASFPVGKIRRHVDQANPHASGPTPKARPAVGQPHPQLPPTADGRR